MKNTNLERFGVENNTQLDYYKKLNSDIWKNKSDEEKKLISNKRKKTLIKKYGVDNPGKSEEIKEKMKNTCMEKYGTEYSLQNKDVIKKRKETNMKRYEFENAAQHPKIIEKIRKTLFKNGYRINSNDYTIFEDYMKKCISETQKNMRKYKFKENWDGYDYYDGEYIKDNYNLYNSNEEQYPNIDHKTSIIYGFLHNINYEEISLIENLCFTKRKHNVSKNVLTEKEYFEKMSKHHK